MARKRRAFQFNGRPAQTLLPALLSTSASEYADDGITGKLPMAARPQGRLLIAALLGDGVKTVVTYDAKRIGRTQPAFWSFIGLSRDSGIVVFDASGTDLTGSVMGGVNGMLAEMDRDATIARMKAGKAIWRAQGKRTDGRWPYGEHPLVEYAHEREIFKRIHAMRAEGMTHYSIAKTLNSEGLRTRYNCEFWKTFGHCDARCRRTFVKSSLRFQASS